MSYAGRYKYQYNLVLNNVKNCRSSIYTKVFDCTHLYLRKVDWNRYLSKNNSEIMGLISISVRHYSSNTLV